MLSAGITYRQFTDNPRSSNAFTYPWARKRLGPFRLTTQHCLIHQFRKNTHQSNRLGTFIQKSSYNRGDGFNVGHGDPIAFPVGQMVSGRYNRIWLLQNGPFIRERRHYEQNPSFRP